jgi:ectoine hydroxylase-related dioxygenase (phytanoyl-CoA dioxygenase family)
MTLHNQPIENVQLFEQLFFPEDLESFVSTLDPQITELPLDHSAQCYFEHPFVQQRILALFELKEWSNVKCSQLKIETVNPNKDTRGWHNDYPYNSYSEKQGADLVYSSKRLDGVVCMLPLDDFSVENGANMYIPFSHLVYRFPTSELLRQPNLRTKGGNLHPMKKKYMLANAGDVIVFPATLWHTVGLNITQKPRRALVATFTRKSLETSNVE